MAGECPVHLNEVLLVGRLAAEPAGRTLPSGDEIVVWRLVVDRPESARAGGSRVDTMDCVAWSAGLRRRALTWRPGDSLEVTGALRRRFWRTPGGPASRYEVEATSVRRLARAEAPVTRRRKPAAAGPSPASG